MRNILDYPKLLRAIIKHSRDLSEGLIIIDATSSDFPIIDINEEFTTISGYKESEIIGNNLEILYGSETQENSIEQIKVGFQNKDIVTTDLLSYKKDGTAFWNRLTLLPVKNSNNKVEYWAVILRDTSSLIEHVNKKTELNVMITMIHTVSDIVFNYMNYLQLFRIRLEEENIDKKILEEFDDNYSAFLSDIKRLNDLDKFNEILLKKGINILDI